MSAKSPQTLAILPLAPGSVLLPGVTIRVPLYGRSDIHALVSALYQGNGKAEVDKSTILLACVPQNSPLLRSDGEPLPQNKTAEKKGAPKTEWSVLNGGVLDHRSLFMYGTLARITGIRGNTTSELALMVEGIQRLRIDRFKQMRPYFEAEVALLSDEPFSIKNGQIVYETPQTLFEELQRRSLELIAQMRSFASLPRSDKDLSPFFAHRLALYVSKKRLPDAGTLADFMANIVDTKVEDKLRVLATLRIPQRVQLVLDLLKRHIEGQNDLIKVTALTSKAPTIFQITNVSSPKQKAIQGPTRPPSLGAQGKPDEEDDEQNELDILKEKLDGARLTAEAQKVANSELKRLRKLNPALSEYSVCRTYLETLADIPWEASTDDKLVKSTLQKAKKQLDDDHYGLEKIKKRLTEYLAVLRLKQTVNANLSVQIDRAREEQKQAGTEDSEVESNDQAERIQVLEGRLRSDKSPILLLVGPPGTGKTSLARSVATALGRKFHRISLGGIRDEAEIRGHRRTYVAAMPGVIVGGLRKVGVNNPVFLLDEIDKVGGLNNHGDPSAALLEVLDPEQNHTFKDHYLDIPFDLSKVLFIATANTLDTIPAPLLDRMETISLSGYTTMEKRHIAQQHLVPKQIQSNGLDLDQLEIPSDVIDNIIVNYTRESGVRNLEREIGSVCRYKAVELSNSQDALQSLESASDESSPTTTSSGPQHQDSPIPTTDYNPRVEISDLETILGPPRFEEELTAEQSLPGVVTGLVAYSSGGQGSILFIEMADMPSSSSSGRVQLTGKLGDVLKESVEVALSWVKSHSTELGLTSISTIGTNKNNTTTQKTINSAENQDLMQNRSIHVHCPSGAVPKDGPSAGLAHTIALISLFSHRPIDPKIAMTGEISLRGRVLPVGGVKEKLIGALRAGVRVVLLPVGNRKDVKEVPEEVKEGLEVVFVS